MELTGGFIRRGRDGGGVVWGMAKLTWPVGLGCDIARCKLLADPVTG